MWGVRRGSLLLRDFFLALAGTLMMCIRHFLEGSMPASPHSIEQCLDCRPGPWPVADMVQANDSLRVDEHVASQLADIATRHPETPPP